MDECHRLYNVLRTIRRLQEKGSAGRCDTSIGKPIGVYPGLFSTVRALVPRTAALGAWRVATTGYRGNDRRDLLYHAPRVPPPPALQARSLAAPRSVPPGGPHRALLAPGGTRAGKFIVGAGAALYGSSFLLGGNGVDHVCVLERRVVAQRDGWDPHRPPQIPKLQLRRRVVLDGRYFRYKQMLQINTGMKLKDRINFFVNFFCRATEI